MTVSAEYSLSGAHVLNRWVWEKLRIDFANDFKKYLTQPTSTTPNPAYGLVPIIPSQQLPEFTNISGGAPFMIYNYSIEGGTQVWEGRDQVGYVIYDDDEARLRRIHNYMVQLLKRMDWTAADVNSFIARSTITSFKEFDIKWVQVTNAAGPQPFESEDGRHGALIMCTVSYTRDLIGNIDSLGNGLGMRS